VRDYLSWFTKFGSIERQFGNDTLANRKLFLKCLDSAEFEEIPFGHYFPTEASDINALFEKYGASAADYFVKRYYKRGERLKRLPEVTFDAVISIEGDQVKREYNKQIRERRRKDTGKYKVSDRYGLYLCKDYIPVQRINEWISGFGSGSNALTLVHGFVNCQELKLTANRGTIANTDPEVMNELRSAIQLWLEEIDSDLRTNGIYTLFAWQDEERTLAQEKSDYDSRVKAIGRKASVEYKSLTLLEPKNESELANLFATLYAIHPELFPFEPLDYNTNRGIDIIAKNRGGATGAESPYWYVELKHTLRAELNHGFKHLRWIVCWDFDKNITSDTEFGSIQENDVRRLESGKEGGKTLYYLNSRTAAVKVQIIRLKEFVKEHLGLEF
jgi:hypothetical protein